jgi:carboxylesterase type B
MFQDAEISNASASISVVRASAAGPGGWLYRFDMPIQRGVDKDLGATHAADVAVTFNNFAGDAHDSVFLYDKNDPEVRMLAANVGRDCINLSCLSVRLTGVSDETKSWTGKRFSPKLLGYYMLGLRIDI